MKSPVDGQSARSAGPIDLATPACLQNTLWRLALIASTIILMIALATVTDMPYADEFLYGHGHECIVPLAFLLISALTWGFYLGAITLEPVMLPVWEQPSRILRVLWTFLPLLLWVLVCRVGPIGSALLIGARHPCRDPDEATGLRSIATPDASPRFSHRWLAGSSPQLLYY